MNSALHQELISALIHAFSELEKAEAVLGAERIFQAGTRVKLNEIEAFVNRAGITPRYGVSYNSRLREARRVDQAANNRVTDAETILSEKRDQVAAVHEDLMRSTRSGRLDLIPSLCAKCLRLTETTSDYRCANVCRCDKIDRQTLSKIGR